MKRILFLLLIAHSTQLAAQNIGIGTTTPNPSAQLDITSTTKGILVPRMTTPQRNLITTPATGLLVFDNTTNSFWFYNGSSWTELITAANTGWGLTGNSGAIDGTSFIGTTTNVPLSFRQNNITIGRLDAGKNNVFLGDLAGGGLETSNNTMIGDHAGHSHFGVGIGHNTFIGSQAGYSNTIATDNTYLGAYAGYANTISTGNTMIGKDAGLNNTAGNNTFIGHSAGVLNTTGSSNVFVGRFAGRLNTTGNNNTANGKDALSSNTTGFNNTATGTDALSSNTTGFSNTAIGKDALSSNTTGLANTSTGTAALASNMIGETNTANGVSSLFSNFSGNNNTAIGSFSLASNFSGNNNTAQGATALYSNTTGAGNTANGANALLSNSTGHGNIAIGEDALHDNTTAGNNTATGRGALYSNTIGSANTAMGIAALFNNTGGDNNTAVGNSAFYSGNFNQSTALGYNTSITASNQVRLGSTTVASIGGFSGWTNVSDNRFKKDITEQVPGLSFILKLRPVSYHLDMDAIAGFLKTPDNLRLKDAEQEKSTSLQTGFVAQEVAQAAKEINFDFSGVDKPKNKDDYYGLRYAEFVVPLVKAVQEQQVLIKALQMQVEAARAEIPTEIGKQQSIIQNQQKQIDELKALVNKLIINAAIK